MTMLTEQELRNQHDERINALEQEISDRERTLTDYRKEHGKLEVLFNRIISNITPIEPLDSVYKRTYQTKNKAKSLITPVGHITDSHMGAIQKPDEIEYFNEFNPEICRRRNLGFATSLSDWVSLHRNAYQIKNLHLVFTGDLISGDIHEELQKTNAFPVTQQVVEAAKVHTEQIALLAPNFEQVTVDFLTEDNHSRLTKKPQAKEAGINSYGYLIAVLMKAYLGNHTNVVFNIHAMHEKVITIGHMNYLIMHGHGMKMWMGIPWYSIERRIARESTARQSLIMQDLQLAKEIGFNKVLHGHFHTSFNSQMFSCGGSVSGTDAYDHQNGRHAEPAQSAWMLHPKWGEFNRTDFWLKRYDTVDYDVIEK
jgi:hypothetical protein